MVVLQHPNIDDGRLIDSLPSQLQRGEGRVDHHRQRRPRYIIRNRLHSPWDGVFLAIVENVLLAIDAFLIPQLSAPASATHRNS